MRMKRFYLLLVMLLSLAGVQTLNAQKFEPVKGELYVIRDINPWYIVDNPDHQCTLTAGHPDQLSLNYEEGSYRELFYIDGDSASGYTIRPAGRPNCYVYAVCDDAGNPMTSIHGGVGVKEVTGEPGDECIWFITSPSNPYRRRLSPKRNPKVFVNTNRFLNSHIFMHPVLRTSEYFLYFYSLADVKTLGICNASYNEVVSAEVEKLKQQGVNATTWDAFQKATDEASGAALPSAGWCRDKSLVSVDEEEGVTGQPYLYSNMLPTEDGEIHTALGSRRMTPEDGRYIWKVSPYVSTYNNLYTKLTGSCGWGINYVGNTSSDYPSVQISQLNASDPNSFLIYLRRANHLFSVHLQYGLSEDGCGKVSDTDWALTEPRSDGLKDANLFEFEHVDEADLPGTPYMVSVSAPEDFRYAVRVEYVGSEDFTGNHFVHDGGYFFLKSTPTAEDFHASEHEGYRCGIVVGEGRVTVTYAESDYEGKYYCIGKRAETLESGKQYAIFNTANSMDLSKDRVSLLSVEKTSHDILCDGLIPCQGAIVPAAYAWTLTQGSAPDLWLIQTEVTKRFVGWSGDNMVVNKTKGSEMRVTEWMVANPDWRDMTVKSLNDDGSFTTNRKISEANRVWTIGRRDDRMFWSGESTTTFSTWVRSLPFAFYELTEVTFPDGIAGVKADERHQSTGTFDLQGRRVQQTRKGIYIQDGRKVVVK